MPTTSTLINAVTLLAAGADNVNAVEHTFAVGSKAFSLEAVLDTNNVQQGEDNVQVQIHFATTESLLAAADAPAFFYGAHLDFTLHKMPHEYQFSVTSTPQIGIVGEKLYAWISYGRSVNPPNFTLKVTEL